MGWAVRAVFDLDLCGHFALAASAPKRKEDLQLVLCYIAKSCQLQIGASSRFEFADVQFSYIAIAAFGITFGLPEQVQALDNLAV